MSTLIPTIAPFVALLFHYVVKFSKNKIAQQIAKAMAAKIMTELKKGSSNVGPVSGSSSGGASGSGSSGGPAKPGAIGGGVGGSS